MYLLGLGLVFLAMKFFEIGPVAAMSWWLVMAPFALAVIWWTWADATGYTKKKAMDRENARRKERIDRTHEALGTRPKQKRR